MASMVGDALAYPCRGENAALMGVGAAFACLPPLVWAALPALPYVGVIGLIVEGLIVGQLLLFFLEVLKSSTKGDSRFPGWPDLTDASSMLSDVMHALGPLVVSFLPAILLWVYFVVSGAFATGQVALTPARLWMTIGLLFAGLCYLPAAYLIFVFHGELAIFNVIGACAAIGRMARDYAVVVILILTLFFGHGAAGWLLARLPAVVAVPLMALFGFYVMTVAMRSIGLLYHRNRERLGWEERPAKS
jgi:hypothetical protein